MVNRFVHRGFWQMKAEMSSSDADPSGLKDGIATLLDMIVGAADPEAALGSEQASARKIVPVNATDKVNKVICDVRVDLASAGPGTVMNTFTDFDYEWGPPAAQVVMESTYAPTIFGKALKTSKQTRMLSRQQADSNPLTVPPDPERRPLPKN
jgi:hypothetical protein